jgi:hypothetical protein
LLTNYEFDEDASLITTQSVLQAALSENKKASSRSLGKNISEIWQGKVIREYSLSNSAYIYRHLKKRPLVSCATILTDFNDATVKKFQSLCIAYPGWIVNSNCTTQKSLSILKIFSSDGEATTVHGRHMTFELLVELFPNPKLTLKNLSTNRLAISLTDVKGSHGTELCFRDIDNVMRLVEFAVPCLGHAISRNTATNFLKLPVSSSRVISAHSKDLGNHEMLVSSSCLLLTCCGCSSCQNCAYALKLFQNREKKGEHFGRRE